jgi:hypothetical protein
MLVDIGKIKMVIIMLKKHVFTLVTTFIAVALVGCANGERNIVFFQRETEESSIIIEETIESVVGETSEEGSNDATSEKSLNSDDVDYYSVSTSKSKQEVEVFAKAVKTSILNDDWLTISKMTAYPITIQGVEYVDAESLANTDLVLGEEYKKALEAASCENLFANSQGIMIGDGEVWIGEILDQDMQSEGLKIIAINAEK